MEETDYASCTFEHYLMLQHYYFQYRCSLPQNFWENHCGRHVRNDSIGLKKGVQNGTLKDWNLPNVSTANEETKNSFANFTGPGKSDVEELSHSMEAEAICVPPYIDEEVLPSLTDASSDCSRFLQDVSSAFQKNLQFNEVAACPKKLVVSELLKTPLAQSKFYTLPVQIQRLKISKVRNRKIGWFRTYFHIYRDHFDKQVDADSHTICELKHLVLQHQSNLMVDPLAVSQYLCVPKSSPLLPFKRGNRVKIVTQEAAKVRYQDEVTVDHLINCKLHEKLAQTIFRL